LKISLVVLQSPDNGQSSLRALKFANTALQQGHEIPRVFFYGDGTLNGHCNSPLAALWQEAAANSKTELILCSTSAEKRGVLPQKGNESGTLAPGFEPSGLGQLLDASLQSDRLITFG